MEYLNCEGRKIEVYDIVDLDFDEQVVLLNNNKSLFYECLEILINTEGYENCDETDFNLIKDTFYTFYMQDKEKYFVDNNWNVYLKENNTCILLNKSII